MLIENFGSGDLPRAIKYGEQGIRIARENDLREELAQIYHDIARPYMRQGRLQDAWEAYHTAQAYWWEADNQPMLADSLASLAESLYYVGDLSKALEYANEALRISQRIESLWGQAYAQFVLATVLIEFGEVDSCLRSLNACQDLSRRGNFTAGLIGSSMVQAWILASLGDLAGAGETARRLAIYVEEYPSFEPMSQLTLCLYKMYGGELEDAMQIYQSLREAHILNSELLFSPYLYSLEVELYLRTNAAERALQQADQSLQMMEASGIKTLLPDQGDQRARALIALGCTAEAYQELQAAHQLAARLEMRRTLWAILLDLADLEADPQRADEYQTQAQEVIIFIAERMSDQKQRQTFLNQPALRRAQSSAGKAE